MAENEQYHLKTPEPKAQTLRELTAWNARLLRDMQRITAAMTQRFEKVEERLEELENKHTDG